MYKAGDRVFINGRKYTITRTYLYDGELICAYDSGDETNFVHENDISGLIPQPEFFVGQRVEVKGRNGSHVVVATKPCEENHNTWYYLDGFVVAKSESLTADSSRHRI